MFINKLVLFSTLVLMTCCKSKTQNDDMVEEKKYEWRPAESAPKHYAAQIYHGSIITEDDKYHTIPYGSTINHGWGTFGTTWAVGEDFKPVPNQLKVIWWSYTEDQFYFLDTELPKEKMTKIFEKGFINDDGKKGNFDEINVGLAPGGVVSVWLLSSSYIVEVGHYQAEKTEVDMKDFNPDGEQDKKIYLNNRAESYSEETKEILATQEIPFGKWTSFRERFFWKPVIKHAENFKLERLSCDFYNGEKYIVSDKNKELGSSNYYPPTNKIAIKWYDKNNNKFGCRIYFDEEEIWEIFKNTLKEKGDTPAELVFSIDKYNSAIKITLEHAGKSIAINKAKINIYDRS